MVMMKACGLNLLGTARMDFPVVESAVSAFFAVRAREAQDLASDRLPATVCESWRL